MRLVHEYNREKVERYLRKMRLEKIALLEELDRHGELSDRAMLAGQYEVESSEQLKLENIGRAEDYLRKALEIYLEMFARGDWDQAENISNCYRALRLFAERLHPGEETDALRREEEIYAQRARDCERERVRRLEEARRRRVPPMCAPDSMAIFARRKPPASAQKQSQAGK